MVAERRWLLPLAVLLAVTGIAACGGGGSDEAADTPLLGRKGTVETEPSTTTTSTTVPADPTEAAILAGYRAGWDAFLRAMDPPDPDLPALAATSTGRALEQTRSYLSAIRGRGNVLRGTMALHPTVQSHTADSAVVLDCIEDSTTERPAASSEQGGSPERVGWQVQMKLNGPTWVQEALFETEAACNGR
jgi:hypothetical protein